MQTQYWAITSPHTNKYHFVSLTKKEAIDKHLMGYESKWAASYKKGFLRQMVIGEWNNLTIKQLCDILILTI